MIVNELKKFATDVRIETVKCLEARTFGHIGYSGSVVKTKI